MNIKRIKMIELLILIRNLILSKYEDFKQNLNSIIQIKNIMDYLDPEEKFNIILIGNNSLIWLNIYLTTLFSNRRLIIINPKLLDFVNMSKFTEPCIYFVDEKYYKSYYDDLLSFVITKLNILRPSQYFNNNNYDMFSIINSKSDIIHHKEDCLRVLNTNTRLDQDVALVKYNDLNQWGTIVPTINTFNDLHAELKTYSELFSNKIDKTSIIKSLTDCNIYDIKHLYFYLKGKLMYSKKLSGFSNLYIHDNNTKDLEEDYLNLKSTKKTIPNYILFFLGIEYYIINKRIKEIYSFIDSKPKIFVLSGEIKNPDLLYWFSKTDLPVVVIKKEHHDNKTSILVSKYFKKKNNTIITDISITPHNILYSNLNSLSILDDFIVVTKNNKNVLLIYPSRDLVNWSQEDIVKAVQYYINLFNDTSKGFKIDNIITIPKPLPRSTDSTLLEYYNQILKDSVS